MMRKSDYLLVIGIDPDVDGSGVGVVVKKNEIRKHQFTLPQLVDFLKDTYNEVGPDYPMMVVIEAGWMNKGNYHLKNKGQHHASKIGEQIGRNHEVGRQIGAFCEYNNIPFEFVPPLRKCWKGKDGKISHEELQDLMEGSVMFPYKGRTNQETRDAILLAMTHSGIPLRINRKK